MNTQRATNHSAAPPWWRCWSPWSSSPSACLRWPGLQARLHVLQIESYQRAQALILLRDMASRISNNRYDAADYVTAGAARHRRGCRVLRPRPRGRRPTPPSGATRIVGASETLGGGNVGSHGRRARLRRGPRRRRVSGDGRLAGTGSAFRRRPPASPAAQNNYNGGVGSQCVNDLCRRVVTTVVRIPTLT